MFHMCHGHTCSEETKGHTAEEPGAHGREGKLDRSLLAQSSGLLRTNVLGTF